MRLATSLRRLDRSVTASAGTTTIKIGVTTVQTNPDNGNGNLLIAQPITLSQVGTIQSLCFYVKTVGGQLRLGLYSGTTPTTLVAQTAAFTPVVGWNTQPVRQPVSCPAGPYSLAYLPASNTLAFANSNAGGTIVLQVLRLRSHACDVPTSPSTTPSNWSFYGTFGVTPDTTPPSVPTNLTATIT